MDNLVAVILAAGLGTRMRSERVKVLHELCGRPMAWHVLQTARQVGAGRIVLVVGHQAERVQQALAAPGVEFVVQAERLGTGHAVKQAAPALGQHTGPVLVTYGDTPLFRPESLQQLLQEHVKGGHGATVLTAVVPDPTGYGRIVRDPGSGAVKCIVEQRDADAEQAAIREINTGTYCFAGPALLDALDRLQADNAQGEYYLPDVLQILQERSKCSIGAVVLTDHDEALGINTRVELATAEGILRRRVLHELMLAGVTVRSPETTYVDVGVRIGRDTVLEPCSVITGDTRVGEGCRIGPYARIADSVIGFGAQVVGAVVEGTRIGEGASVQPFTHWRRGDKVAAHQRVAEDTDMDRSDVEGAREPHSADQAGGDAGKPAGPG